MARKPGRPKREIDYEAVGKLASIFCTQQEIAAFIDVPLSTCQHNAEFKQVYAKGHETAKISLRRKQYKLADRNASMAIFLGKNYLGQRDVQDERDDRKPETHDFKFELVKKDDDDES